MENPDTTAPPADTPAESSLDVGGWFDGAINWVTTQLLPNALAFVIVIIVAWIISAIVSKAVVAAIDRKKTSSSALLRAFCKDWSRRVVRVIGVMVALETVGVATAPIIAGLGVAGFIVGFAVQGTLSNFASGMMLLIYQPFDEGQVIETGGVIGKVTKLNIVSTTLLTPDNREVVIPNSSVWGSTIINITSQDTRRVDLVLGVGYDVDLEKAVGLIRETLKNHPQVLDEPESQVEVLNWGDSSVDLAVRPWSKTADYWDVFFSVQRDLKVLFDQEGIEIPFPQRVVHMRPVEAAT